MSLRLQGGLNAVCLVATAAVLALAGAAPAAASAATPAADAWRAIEFRAGITPGCSITDITRGPDGNFWFAEYANQAIGRITPQGKVLEIPLPIDAALGPFGFPPAITVGPDGNLWFVRRSGRRRSQGQGSRGRKPTDRVQRPFRPQTHSAMVIALDRRVNGARPPRSA